MSSLTITDEKTLTVNNTITLSGDDETTLDLSAWQSYVPDISSTTGPFTTVDVTASYKQIGKTVVFQISIQMIAIGTASGALYASLPLMTAEGCVFVIPSRENALTGKMCQGHIGGNETNLWIHYYDNTSVIVNGNWIYLSGIYQSV